MNLSSTEYQQEREARFKREREMFEKTFMRPRNYFKLTPKQQWDIDAALGILDWTGAGMTDEERTRYHRHYDV